MIDLGNMKFDLIPLFDSRKSLYGKAFVIYKDHFATLYSYDTEVVTVDKKSRKVSLTEKWDASATTLRHVKEFLKQHGFTATSKSQMEKDYS